VSRLIGNQDRAAQIELGRRIQGLVPTGSEDQGLCALREEYGPVAQQRCWVHKRLGTVGSAEALSGLGQLELSNNLAGNAIRPVAVCRKNWLHVGSERAGPRVAAILSVVETCRRHQIPIRQYLSSVLPGLA
jgi:hypothetical protein